MTNLGNEAVFCLCKLQRNPLFGLFPSKKNGMKMVPFKPVEKHTNWSYKLMNISKSAYASYLMNNFLLLINIQTKGSVKRKHLIFGIMSDFLVVIFAH